MSNKADQKPFAEQERLFPPDEIRTYKETGKARLQLHVFYPAGHGASDKRPGIVFFFGGGWTGGTPAQFYSQCRHLAEKGIVAFSAEYRVESRDGTTPRECVKDGKSALRWVRRHAGELGIDPEQILAGGGSAGGHVAAAAGTLRGFEEAGEDITVSSRPAGLLLFNPVFDNGPGGWGHERVRDYWQEISPLHNIDSGTPPALVILGTEDQCVPAETAREFQSRMVEAGCFCDLHLYEGQVHGFFNYGRGDYYQKTLDEMDRFLIALGYLSLS